ncbi:MAG: PKD domain-containing protein, partial [Bacteroidia bacterium]
NTSSVSSGTISSYVWKFGDGSTSQQQNPHHKYAASGVYNVCLLATTNNGCIDSICKSVMINTPPTANFIVNNDCQGNTLNLVNTSTSSGLSSYSWSFGNGSTSTAQTPGLSYSSAGNYVIQLIVADANGCIDTVQNQVTVFPLPQVTASNNLAICSGQSAILTVNGASSYSWIPGGVGQTINVSPTVTTNYIVTGTDANGCIDTAMVNIVVNVLPVINLSNPVICPSSSVILNAGNPGSGYQWSTGVTSQSITTSVAGSYNVTVTNSFGCTATGQSMVGASTLTSNVQSFSICQGTSTTLNAANPGSTYHWSTGAATQIISVNNTGTYTVTVSDAFGCSLSFASTLIVNPLPIVNFNTGAVCLNDSTILVNSSHISSGSLSAYHWDFGDGDSSAEQNPKHVYLNAGTFTTTLSVISDSGCTSDKSAPAMIHPNPSADFAPSYSCAGYAMILNDMSSVSAGSIFSRKWDFGDSTTVSTVANPAHVYTLAGVYHVTLISVSNYGCTDTISKPVIVNPNPVTHFNFDKTSGCGPLTIHFTDSSYISTGNIVSWQWNFGDGTSSIQQNPSHTYNAAGTFTVTLITTSGEGCTDSYTKVNAITVYPDPVAEFIYTPDEPNILQLVSFENQSINAISYNWSFGDGSSTQVVDPVHNFDNPGTYTVILKSTNQYGCIAEARHEIHIVPTWTVYIPNAFTPDNDGNNDIFTIQGIGIMKYNIKIFNRWGDLIFDADNRGWDGLHYGTVCKQDVYIYKVVFEVNTGGSFDRNGQVSLIK